MSKCVKDAVYLNYQRSYCRFISDTYDHMENTIDYLMQQPIIKKKKCAIVWDIDATISSEDDCTNREIFSRAMNAIKSLKSKYKQKLTMFIITARRSDYGVVEDFGARGITFGKKKDIEYVYYDHRDIGTVESKIQNRQSVRDQGYTIISAIGDGIYDLVPEHESDGYARTANFLLPNIYRHHYE